MHETVLLPAGVLTLTHGLVVASQRIESSSQPQVRDVVTKREGVYDVTHVNDGRLAVGGMGGNMEIAGYPIDFEVALKAATSAPVQFDLLRVLHEADFVPSHVILDV